jgi:Cu(I)/Ag(I) efflux system membrane fusion protein
MLGSSYVIISGLNEGEEIVTQGTFSVDAAAQLEGKPSMMNQDGGKTSTGHNHGDMQDADEKEANTDHSNHSSKEMVKHETFAVSGNCEMCKERIETAAKSVKGVTSAVWDVQTKKIHVQLNASETNLSAVHKAISLAGHDTEKLKADNKTYEALPECCLYRK